MAEPQTNQNIGFKISFYVFDKETIKQKETV